MFALTVGTHLLIANIHNRSFKPLLKWAGLPNVPFHALRHTGATLLAQAGEQPLLVQQIMGHSSVRVTMETYPHAFPGIGREAAAKMDSMLEKPATTREATTPTPDGGEAGNNDDK
ncbi:MAG: tyrosine-type recombinase/integrase [Chloroflexi bacterium]|nr:tyrosine-type recombinase/integrase [Chloroflexota bacterium]